jgi:hypothetical protein
VVLVTLGAFGGCGGDGVTENEQIADELSGAMNRMVGVESEGAYAVCDRLKPKVFDCMVFRLAGHRVVTVSYDVRADTSDNWTARLDRQASDDEPEVPGRDDPKDSAGFPEQVGGAAVPDS